MTGLKTLKDLHEEDPQPCCGEIEVNKLRKEAIKWIKDIPGERIKDIEVIAIRVWIKTFFNLTEDDLK